MSAEPVEIRSEPRGSHWVAWAVRPGGAEMAAPVLMVGQTREEAVSRLQEWWAARRP